MGREIFIKAKNQIISSGLEIEESVYEEATNNWYIVLETVKKIRITWESANKYLSVEEATMDADSTIIDWRYIFTSKLSSQNEILTTLESLLKSE